MRVRSGRPSYCASSRSWLGSASRSVTRVDGNEIEHLSTGDRERTSFHDRCEMTDRHPLLLVPCRGDPF